MILEEHPEAAADRSLKILEAGQIEEEDFFCHATHKTLSSNVDIIGNQSAVFHKRSKKALSSIK